MGRSFLVLTFCDRFLRSCFRRGKITTWYPPPPWIAGIIELERNLERIYGAVMAVTLGWGSRVPTLDDFSKRGAPVFAEVDALRTGLLGHK